jgi:beta-phosphoglucomutase
LRAVIFDVDGTLVQTECLKARSYAIAAQQLLELDEPDERAIEAYREIVGAARKVASRHVMEKLGLRDVLSPLVTESAGEPEDVLTGMRLEIYNGIVRDPEVLRANRWPHTVDLLRVAHEGACQTALATMSKRDDVLHVIHSLGIEEWIDLVLTSEDVSKPKPDPEIYLLAARRLAAEPRECLAIEDSVNGVTSALAAGFNVVAIATPFTNAGLHASEIIDDVWIVHRPEDVAGVVRKRIAEHDRGVHGA